MVIESNLRCGVDNQAFSFVLQDVISWVFASVLAEYRATRLTVSEVLTLAPLLQE